MQLPKSAIISKVRAANLVRTAKEHVQVVQDRRALHLVKQDAVTYVVNEMSLAQAKKIGRRKSSR